MKKIIVVSIISLFISTSTFLYFFLNKEKIAYVEINDLYSKFELTKSMDQEFKKVVSSRERVLDSMKLELQMMVKTKMNLEQEKNFVNQRKLFLEKTEQFKQDNQALSQEYLSKIWNRLNRLIKKYGKENGYTYIYGANGEGNLLYANDKKNITNDLIEFINTSYLGDKK